MSKTEAQLAIEEKVRQRLAQNAQESPQQQVSAVGSGYTRETIPRAQTSPREEYSAAGAMQNIIPSAKAYGQTFVDLAKDPSLFVDAVKLMFTGEGLSSLKDYYAETYGSPEAALRKAYQDPVMFMSDLSVAGAPVRVLSKLTNLASKKAGTAIGKVGSTLEAADPVSSALAASGAAISNLPGVRGFPEQTYETNLKMGTSPTSKYSDPKVRSRVVDTLLREQVAISPEGLEKLNKVISARTKELDELIEMADREGKTIPISTILGPLKRLRDDISDPKTNPLAVDQAAKIEEYAMNWLADLGPVRAITPSDARKLRQNLDRQIRWGKQDVVTPPLQRQITEEMASGARQGLREAVEGYGQTGMDISRLLEAEEPLRRAQSRMGQNNTLGLRQAGGLATGAIVGAGGDAFNQIMGFLIAGGSAIMTPQNKERLARLIYQTRDLTADQKRTLLGYVGTQTAPTVERMQQSEAQ